jgi:Acetyltransferase (GNAT) domain
MNRSATGDLSRRLRIEVFDPLEHAAYDEMVSACPDNVPFHSRAWLRIIRDTYGHRPICFVAKSGDGVQAMLPIVEVQSWITGRRGVMLPFADCCPPMASDAAAYDLVLAEAVKYAQERRWKYLEFRGGRKWMPEAQASVAFHAHILDLSAGTDQLFGRLEGRMRTAIRKAEKEGVRVEVLNAAEAIETYYTLHCETRKKHGVPPQPFSFFQNLYSHAISKGSGIVVVARYQGVPIAAAVFMHYGRQAVYKFSASNAAFLRLCGNNVVLWEAIKWYANHGLSSMHFGRTSFGNDGLRKYKTGWGAEETKLEYFRYSLPKQAYVVDQDRSEGGHNRFLGLLPRPLFRMAGQVLYRHLS